MAKLAGLAGFALSHSAPYVTVHVGPIPPELQLGEHPLDSCVGLLMGVPYQLPADGSWADHPLPCWLSVVGGQSYGQQTIWPDPQGVPTLTVQPQLGASLSSLFVTGSSPFLFSSVHVGYHPWKVSLELP